MLTVHHYHKLNDNWDKDSIKECCKTTTVDEQPCDDCGYDTWSDKLKQVSKYLKAKQEKSAQLQKKTDFLKSRRDTFKTWLDEMDEAQKQAQDICKQLELIATQSNKIWANSFLAVKAIQVLFCMIRDFYSQLDYLKERYDLLQKCIAKNPDPSLVAGQGIRKCLDEYGVKLDAIIKTCSDIIKAAVDAVRLSNLLRNNISTREWPVKYVPCVTPYDPCATLEPDCPSHNHHHGFKTIICEWHRLFNCDEACNDDCSKAPNNNQQISGNAPKANGCQDDCCELNTFRFPICNDDYRECVKKRYKDDDSSVKKIEVELKEVNKEKEALQACKNSLEAAIKAVDPAARCK